MGYEYNGYFFDSKDRMEEYKEDLQYYKDGIAAIKDSVQAYNWAGEPEEFNPSDNFYIYAPTKGLAIRVSQLLEVGKYCSEVYGFMTYDFENECGYLFQWSDKKHLFEIIENPNN